MISDNIISISRERENFKNRISLILFLLVAVCLVLASIFTYLFLLRATSRVLRVLKKCIMFLPLELLMTNSTFKSFVSRQYHVNIENFGSFN